MVAQEREYFPLSLLIPQKTSLVVLGDLIDPKKLAQLGLMTSFEFSVFKDLKIKSVSADDVIILLAQNQTAFSIACQIENTPIIWITDKFGKEDLALAIASGIKAILKNLDNLTLAVESVKRGSNFFDPDIISRKNNFFKLTSQYQIKQFATKISYYVVENWIEKRSFFLPSEKVLQNIGLSQSHLIEDLLAIKVNRSQLHVLIDVIQQLQNKKDNKEKSAWKKIEEGEDNLERWLLLSNTDLLSKRDKLIKKSQSRLNSYLCAWQKNGTQFQCQDLSDLIENLEKIAQNCISKIDYFSFQQKEASVKYTNFLEEMRCRGLKKLSLEVEEKVWAYLYNLFEAKALKQIYQLALEIIQSFSEQAKLDKVTLRKNNFLLKEVRDLLLSKLENSSKIKSLTKAYIEDFLRIEKVEQQTKILIEESRNEWGEYCICAERVEEKLTQYFQEQIQQNNDCYFS